MSQLKDYQEFCVGIDISKDDFKVSLMGRLSGKIDKVLASKSFQNNLKGFEALLLWQSKHLKKYASLSLPLRFVMEATGVYHENLSWYLYEQGADVSIVLGNQSKLFRKSEGIKTKNDKVDAKVLALMGLAKNLRVWEPISLILKDLRTQTRHHEYLQKEKNRAGNRLHALEHSHQPDSFVVKQLKAQIKFLDKALAQTLKRIEELVQSDEDFYEKLQYLISLRGIGLLSATTLVAESNAFQLFQNQKQLTSFAGYDIQENQSGNRKGKTSISKKGNSHIRRILYMPAFRAVQEDNIFKKLFERVFERTKSKMKAYVAVQRKMLCICYTLWKKQEKFDINYQENKIKVEEPKAPLHEIEKV